MVSFRSFCASLEIWTDLVDFSTFVDRYEMESLRNDVFCLQFSPDGQLLATGTNDGKINVRSLKMNFFCRSHATWIRYGISLKSE